MPRISNRVIATLEPHPTNDTFAWDSDLKGFGVRAKPSGAKAYLIQYRNPEGRSHRLVIGKVGALTPDEARAIARNKLADVAKGGDPVADRRAIREAPTVAEICDWYLEQAAGGRILGRKGRPIKETTLAVDRSRIETHLKPLIGRRKMSSLTLDDIEDMQADIAAGKTSRERKGRGGVATGGQAVAGRTVGMLHTIFEHAVRRRKIEANPAKGVRKAVASKKRDRRLSIAELRSLGRAMRAAEKLHENVTGLAAIRLLLLTGFRRLEALSMEWTWVDFDDRCVHFPDTKSGAQDRVISSAALDFLRSQLSKVDGSFVFPGDIGHSHFIGIVGVLGRVCSRAHLRGVTPHVLRHTFASVAGDLGFTEMTVAALLGHSSKGVTQRYVHLDAALIMAADRISTTIAEALDAE